MTGCVMNGELLGMVAVKDVPGPTTVAIVAIQVEAFQVFQRSQKNDAEVQTKSQQRPGQIACC